MRRPRLPGMFKEPKVRPSCARCATRILKRLRGGNDGERTDAELREQARLDARMVALGDDWLCPNCTTIPTPDGEVPLRQVLPNRAARRAAARR